ncbi:MAG: NAD-dependent epimerase/dehydratase family protein [Dehalococcoidia bacterium]
MVALASSVALYEPTARAATEADPPRRDPSPYARMKAWSEQLFAGWERFDRRACSLRLSTVYGPGETGHRAIPAMIEAALAGRPLRVDAEGSATFDPVFVGDVARAFTLAAVRRASGTFNIAGGYPIEVGAVARTIVALTGSASAIEVVPSATGGRRPTCDITRACEVLGFTPRVALDAGLALEIEWQRARMRLEV